MYICSNCGLRIGAADETDVDEPSRMGPCCVRFFRDDFDADELGLDPEEPYE